MQSWYTEWHSPLTWTISHRIELVLKLSRSSRTRSCWVWSPKRNTTPAEVDATAECSSSVHVSGFSEHQILGRLGDPRSLGIPIMTSAPTREARASCTAQLRNAECDSASLVVAMSSKIVWAVAVMGCCRRDVKRGKGRESHLSGSDRWMRPLCTVACVSSPAGYTKCWTEDRSKRTSAGSRAGEG